jgi:glucose dehydrogenase
MSIALTAITGGAQVPFTTPGYTVTQDTSFPPNGKQWLITGVTGTQTGVTLHTVASPFRISFQRPPQLYGLGVPNPSNGVVYNVKNNTYRVVTNKGVTILAGQPIKTMIIRTEIEVPAGADLADSANVLAAISAHAGALMQQSSGLGDTVKQGNV